MKRLEGKPVRQSIRDEIKASIASLKEKNVQPKLAIVRMGERQDDIAYERSIIKNCEALEIDTYLCQMSRDVSLSEFKQNLDRLNEDTNIHGILIFRPLPDQLPEEQVKYLIDPEKDIDCMHPLNLSRVFEGDLDGLVPCTPKAVMKILEYYEIPLVGANVAVINGSVVVGKPLTMMLLKERATVTICHSKTKDLPKVAAASDIVVTAIGRGKFFGKEYFSQQSVVIDVGINTDEAGNLCGDVDYDQVYEEVQAITPVPAGVGTVTTTILLENLIRAALKTI